MSHIESNANKRRLVTILLRIGGRGIQPHLDPTHPPTAHKHQKRSLSYFSTHAHGRMDQRMDQRMDKASYRVVCPQLKTVSRLLILIVLDNVSVESPYDSGCQHCRYPES